MIRHALIFWGSTLLAAWGLVSMILGRDKGSLIILMLPVLLFAFVIWKYNASSRPVVRSSSGSKIKVKPSQKTMAKVAGIRKNQTTTGKRKNYPFQVIEGSKGKNDEKFPKYH